MTSLNWNWLGTSSSPRSQYKSALPFLPTIAKNRQVEQFRENLPTGNSEYGAFWGIDVVQRSNNPARPAPPPPPADVTPQPPQPPQAQPVPRDHDTDAYWKAMQADADQYLKDLHSRLQAGRGGGGGAGWHGRYHANCEICSRYLTGGSYVGYGYDDEEEPLMRVHRINMMNLGYIISPPVQPHHVTHLGQTATLPPLHVVHPSPAPSIPPPPHLPPLQLNSPR